MKNKTEVAFEKKVQALIKQANNMETDAVIRTIGILADARKEVAATVASTDWQAYHLPQFKAAIDRALQDFGHRYGVELLSAQRGFWDHGIDMVDLPLREIGIMAVIPAIDTTALSVMQGYAADLVTNLKGDAAKRIVHEMTMGLMGQKTPFEVMEAVGRNLKEPSIFKSIAARAETITRNECGRVLEMSSQARREKAAEVVPGLKKQWIHGQGSRKPRPSHIAANGQIRDQNQPFDVGGEKLMYPRDPAGSAHNTINCSCFTVPYHANWETALQSAGVAA